MNSENEKCFSASITSLTNFNNSLLEAQILQNYGHNHVKNVFGVMKKNGHLENANERIK